MNLAREEFAKQLAAELQRVGSTGRWEFDAEEFSLRCEAPEAVINLGNFYAEHEKLPQEGQENHLRQIVVSILSSHQELPDELEHARHDLRLKLWCRASIDKTDLKAQVEGKPGIEMPLVPVGKHLYASVVFDFPTSVRSIQSKELEAWDITPYEAIEIAKQNLIEDEAVLVSSGDSFYASVTGDSYDATRLLLTDRIRGLTVEGDPIAMVPNRDCLLITGSDDEDGLATMLQVAEQATQDPRPMLPLPLRLTGDEWVDWMPPADHPLYQTFQLLELKYLYPEYNEQQELLNALHDARGEAVYAASLTAVKREDESLLSYTVWSEGLEILLPKSQYVVFSDAESEGALASGTWDRVHEVVGDVMEETDWYPLRYRVHSFPTPEQLEAIGKAL